MVLQTQALCLITTHMHHHKRTPKDATGPIFAILITQQVGFICHGRSSRGICFRAILRSLQEPTALRRSHGSPWPDRLGCNKGRARQDAGQNQSPISGIIWLPLIKTCNDLIFLIGFHSDLELRISQNFKNNRK